MTTSTCLHCGGPASVTHEARYDEDLPTIVLDPLEVHRCPTCGESVVIRRLSSLHVALRDALLRKPHRLTGRELRFLRQGMGWSEADGARHLGVEEDLIDRWERDEDQVDLEIDRLLRLVVAATKDVALPLEGVAGISDQVLPLRARARLTAGGWHVEPEPDGTGVA